MIKRNKSLLGIALAGSLSLGGCTEAINNADLASLGFGLIAISPDQKLTQSQRESAGYLSAFSGEQGRRIHEVNIAREGRDQITINNSPYVSQSPQYPQVQSLQNSGNLLPEYDLNQLRSEYEQETVGRNEPLCVFTYDRYVDMNGDNFQKLDEFTPKRNFARGEKINFALAYANSPVRGFLSSTPQNADLELIVSNENGQIVFRDKTEDKEDNSYERVLRYSLSKDLPSGVYDFRFNMRAGNKVSSKGGVFQVTD